MTTSDRILHERKRRLYRQSLFLYAQDLLGYDKLEPDVHGPLCTKLQELYWDVDRPQYAVGGLRRVLILMPRGSFKSTVATQSFPAWIMHQNDSADYDHPDGLERWEPPTSFNGKKGFNQRLLIANEVQANAKTFLRNIKSNLQNPRVVNYFGDITPTVRTEGLWTTEKANVKTRTDFAAKEPNFSIASLDQAVNSQHFDLGIYDDLISRAQVNTKEQIEKTIDFYKEQLPLLDHPALMVVIGTRWHDADLYGHFQEADSEKNKWEVIIERAERTDQEVAAGKRRLFFPQVLTEKVLADKRESMGPSFYSAQMQNEPVDEATQIFKKEYFTGCVFELPDNVEQLKTWLAQLSIFTSCDPAITDDKAGCEAVITTCGWDYKGICWVLDMFAEKDVHSNRLLKEYFRQYQKWRAIKCGIESVGFQKMLLQNAQQMSLDLQVFPPWEELKPDKRSKDLRIRGLEPVFANNRFRYQRHMQAIVAEAIRYPRGRSKDKLDALAYQLDMAFPGQEPETPEQRMDPNSIELEQEELKRQYEEHRARLTSDRGDGWWYTN